ncbi:MAG TPA: ESX secretion-associated protein EspG [Actinophytocola sp.]|uniref:ESX secretion-associated protein EspG n=1 Tax=Actinophytocola sp. TaxID=1872138 RepID=UPI002DDD4B1A|nr:ESX secretion-associated protein EspG [Actinophytocola sp.]HEV2777894.1 ESX secretion-associated protein EspG [Actinophytocola sp.]
MTNAVHLSHAEFDIVWELLGLGEHPYPISVPSFGATMDERAALRDRVLRELAERGLHDGRELHPRLEDLLVMLVRNRFTIDGQLAVGRHLRVLAAGRGDYGLLAVLTDDDLRLEPVRGGAVVSAVVALLPDEKPGPGGPVTLPSALFGEAAEAYEGSGYLGFERVMQRGGITGRGLRTLSTLVESGRHGGGQLAANSVDRVGRRTRSAVLNWFDTEAGRYVVYAERRRDREEWLTFTPGDAQRIAQRLTDLVASVNP